MTAHTISYKTSNTILVPVSELTIGMRVTELDCPWEESPFLFQGFTIDRQEELDTLRRLCNNVTVDVFGTVDVKLKTDKKHPRAVKSSQITKTSRAPAYKHPVEQEIQRAKTAYQDSGSLIRTMLDDVRLGLAIDTPQAKELVSNCVDSILRNPDALLLLSNMKDKDDYTAQHCLNVAILSVCLGRHMGLEHKDLVELGLCGLLHDVGKLLTPNDILNKPGRLSADEFEIMMRHTTHGRNILMSNDQTPLAALDVAHAHHEALDGSGYPRALTVNSLSLWTKAVAITDTYDAMTSDRCYRRGDTSFQALRMLHSRSGIRFDPKLLVQFIRAVGIFPPGSVVQLSCGRTAVVLQSHPKLKLRPRVLVVRDVDGEAVEPHTLDLAETMTDAQGRLLNVIQVVHAREVGVNLKDLEQSGWFAPAV